MLAAVDAGTLVWITFVGLMMVASLLAKRSVGKLRDSLEVRDGRVVLKESARRELARSPRRLRRAEALIARSYVATERGEIIERSRPVAPANVPWYRREISFGKKVQAPPSASPPEPAVEKIAEKERFRSAWDEQDAAPSIWDENDEPMFWSDAEKLK